MRRERSIRLLVKTGPARGISAQIIVLSSVLGVQILQVPVYLSVLSPEVYGSFLVLIAVPTTAAMADFGLLSASSTRLLTLVARKQNDAAEELFRLTFSIVAAISVILLVIAAFISNSLDLAQPGINANTARTIVFLYVIYAVLCLHSSICEMAMRGNNAYATAWLWIAGIRIIEFVACSAVLILTSSLATAVCGLVVSRAIGLASLLIKAKKTVPWVSFRPLFGKSAALQGLLRPTLGSAALPVGNSLLNQGLVLAINAALGPSSVVIYTTGRTLMNTSRQITNAIANGVLPSLTQYTALGNVKKAARLLRISLLFSCCAAAAVSLLLILLGPKIVELWTLNELKLPTNLLLLLALLSLPEACWLVLSLRLLAANEHFGYATMYVGSALAVLTIAFAVDFGALESFVWILIAQSLTMVLVTFLAGKRSLTKNELV